MSAKRVMAAGVLMALLAGCGTRGAVESAAVGGFEDGVTRKANAATASEHIARMTASYKAMRDFTATLVTTDDENGKGKPDNYSLSAYMFKKARKARARIVESNDKDRPGTIALYLGGDQVHIRLPKPIPILGRDFKLDIDDDRVTNSRGYRFDQVDLEAMVTRANYKDVQAKVVGPRTVAGRPGIELELTNSFKRIDEEVVRETIVIDDQTGLPIMDEVAVAAGVVMNIEVRDLKVDVGLTDKQFVLDEVAGKDAALPALAPQFRRELGL